MSRHRVDDATQEFSGVETYVSIDWSIGADEDHSSALEYLRRYLAAGLGIPVRFLWPDPSRESQLAIARSKEKRRAAEARAEELLTRVLTPGERQALDKLGVIPVIGGETGDLVLVSKGASWNLLRYERRLKPRRWLRFLPPREVVDPQLYCVQGRLYAPRQDHVASIVLSLRGAESDVWAVANHSGDRRVRTLNLRGWLNIISFRSGGLEIALEPHLRQLAECRCEDPKLLEAVARAAEAGGGLTEGRIT